jgi:epoxyqueuosine reductase
MPSPDARTEWVCAQARALGFDLCGVAPAGKFPELEHLPEWLERGYGGEMHYLHDQRRLSPLAAMPEARSIIVCALNYNTPFPYSTEARAAAVSGHAQRDPAPAGPREECEPFSSFRLPFSDSRGWISRYAWGDDYHIVLGEKLEALVAAMRREFVEHFSARAYVDTGPVVERVAAKWAGLGWLGKNTCLINKDLGSWLFLGVILTSLELAPSLASEQRASSPEPRVAARLSSDSGLAARHAPLASIQILAASVPPDLCGQCTQCIEACPTGALVEPYVLDARRCISYLTIELRGPMPDEFHDRLGWHVFGCDICQDVCPYNRHAPASHEPRFLPREIKAQDLRPEVRGSKLEDADQQSDPTYKKPDVRPRPCTAAPPLAARLSPPGSFYSSPTASHSPLSLFAPPLEWLASLSESEFRRIFSRSALRRARWQDFQRNVRLAGNRARRA